MLAVRMQTFALCSGAGLGCLRCMRCLQGLHVGAGARRCRRALPWLLGAWRHPLLGPRMASRVRPRLTRPVA